MTFWTCLFLSELKAVFQFFEQSLILNGSSFSVADEALTLLKTEKCQRQTI